MKVHHGKLHGRISHYHSIKELSYHSPDHIVDGHHLIGSEAGEQFTFLNCAPNCTIREIWKTDVMNSPILSPNTGNAAVTPMAHMVHLMVKEGTRRLLER